MAMHTLPPGARPVMSFVLAVTAIAGVPVSIAAFAQANPLDDPRCSVSRDLLASYGETFVADVRTCQTLGVEVSRAINPVEG